MKSNKTKKLFKKSERTKCDKVLFILQKDKYAISFQF